METQDQKYKLGELVVANEAPLVQLKVRRFVDRIYYCKRTTGPGLSDLVYFEREIRAI